MVVTAMKAGLRQGELLALRWEDIDLVSGLLRVRRSVTRGVVTVPKSGKGREVPLGDEILASLKAERHLRGPLVFCTADGRKNGGGRRKSPEQVTRRRGQAAAISLALVASLDGPRDDDAEEARVSEIERRARRVLAKS